VLLSSAPRAYPSRLAWLKRTPIAVPAGRINRIVHTILKELYRSKRNSGRRYMLLLCNDELYRYSLANLVSSERSLPVAGEGFSGLHAPSGHLWRCLGRDRIMDPRLAVAAPPTASPEGGAAR
jgi:hypothetical protein